MWKKVFLLRWVDMFDDFVRAVEQPQACNSNMEDNIFIKRVRDFLVILHKGEAAKTMQNQYGKQHVAGHSC